MATYVEGKMSGRQVLLIVCQWANEEEGDKFALFLHDGKPGVAVADGVTGESGLIGSTVLEAGSWYLLAGTWDPLDRRYRLFVNGNPEPSVGYQKGDGINASCTTTLKIGAEAVPDNERHFRGMIDEVMLFESVLALDDIKQLHAGKVSR